jgi:hypothetical protein
MHDRQADAIVADLVAQALAGQRWTTMWVISAAGGSRLQPFCTMARQDGTTTGE